MLPSQKISLAPMMDCTDVHCRALARIMTQKLWLYTEMLTAQAVIHGDRERLLAFPGAQSPIAIQLGGSDPALLAQASKIACDWGYDEINLNVGCPSDRVQSGAFGACLMLQPERVATCVKHMQDASSVPVTVKTRIGVDAMEDYAAFIHFIDTVHEAGVMTFIIHARKAWLQGLSPKENRSIPPLRYDWVDRLKQDRPHLTVILNGGLNDWSAMEGGIARWDGVMVGRAFYRYPHMMASVDQRCFGSCEPVLTPYEVLQAFVPYMREQQARGVRMGLFARHLVGLFHGLPGAKLFRRYISEHAHQADSPSVFEDAAACLL
jgi:tRNA-dihydrouridine synthase A